MTSPYVAKRVKDGVPIWDILAHGQVIGCATVFDYEGEGPLATVRYCSDEAVTFQGDSIRGVLEAVGTYLREVDAELEAQAEAEYYAEVIGPMEAEERAAEDAYRGGEDEPIF